MSSIIPIRDVGLGGASAKSSLDVNGGGPYSPAKDKAASRGGYSSRATPLLLRRLRHGLLAAPKLRLLLIAFFILCVVVFFTSRLSSFMGWISHHSSSSSRGGYAVLINTWKRNSLLKQTVAHYASCDGADAIHVVWRESDLPSDGLRTLLEKMVFSKSQAAHKPNLKFNINEEGNLNNRFKPIEDLSGDAIFSVDDDVIVPCHTLDFAFTVWQSTPLTMVGFVPRLHWLEKEENGLANYKYGGWWSVWWMGTYSMVLSKAAFFHKKYLDLYTYEMPSSMHDYVTNERNCEDIAMSLLVANATGAPPIWVKGKIYETGSFGISSLKGHNKRRDKCLNDFISLYGKMPLVSTNVKAVSAKEEWFW